MSSALVVYSGGLDSYTLLNKALQNFKKVEAITFDYGQKHKKEIDYAKNNCHELGITHKVIKLDIADLLSNSALVGDSKIPEGNYDKEKMKQTIDTIKHLDSMKAVKVAFDLSESNQDSINKTMQVISAMDENMKLLATKVLKLEKILARYQMTEGLDERPKN